MFHKIILRGRFPVDIFGVKDWMGPLSISKLQLIFEFNIYSEHDLVIFYLVGSNQ